MNSFTSFITQTVCVAMISCLKFFFLLLKLENGDKNAIKNFNVNLFAHVCAVEWSGCVEFGE